MSSSRAGGSGLTSFGEVQQLVGAVAHRGHGDDDVVAGALALDDPSGHPLDAGGVGEGGAAVLLHDNAHNDFLTGTTTRLGRAAPATTGRFYRGSVSCFSNISLAAATWSSSPVKSASSRSWATIDCRARRVALALLPQDGDVGELPPPQRLLDVAGAVVAQPVGDLGGDAGQVVGELGRRPAPGRRGRSCRRRCRRRRASSPAEAHGVEVGVGADIRLVLLLGSEVRLGSEPGPGEQHLADLEQQQRDRPAAVLRRGRSPAARPGSSRSGRRSVRANSSSSGSSRVRRQLTPAQSSARRSHRLIFFLRRPCPR